MADLYKYGTAVHLFKPVIKRAVVDFAVGADWTPAAGDVKISKDGGAAANVTNLPTALTMGNTVLWDFSLTATEMQAAKVRITVADSATKAVEDTAFEIDTYGNASAEHAADLDNATSLGLANLDAAISSRSTVTTAQVNTECDTALADYDGPTFAEMDARTDAIELDTQDIQSRLPAALVSSRMDSHVGAVAANAIGDAALGSDMDGYSAKIWLFDDNGGTADRYEVAWFKNSNWIRSGITLPKIQVYKSLDGSDLVGEAAMTEISSLHLFKKTESTNRIVGGASYWAVARATIDGDVREWPQPVGRDST